MPSVFISYRHEDADHRAAVLDLARQLESAGITVVLDTFAQDREFNGGGPDVGWPQWSRKQARNRDHKILIVASMGWFKCYLQDDDSGEGLGSAAESVIIAARLYRERGVAVFFRIVKVGPFDNNDIPDELGVYQVFQSREDFSDIVRWLNAGPTRQPQAPRRPQAPPQPGPLTFTVNKAAPQPPANSADIDWEVVPAGPYQRGFTAREIETVLRQITDPSIDVDSVKELLRAEPARRVDVPEFRIAQDPVTNAQFRRFVDAAAYRTTAERNGESETWRDYATPEKMNHPVVQVSFEDAQAFCQWAGVRLPTLDEWMKACRGPDGNLYPWGNEFDAGKCNTQENKTVRNTSPVDLFAAHASPYGCHDMVGNVNEWVDASGDTGPRVRNMHPAQIEQLKRTRAIMGGSWQDPCQAFGLPVMTMLAPIAKSTNDLGFRVAR